MTTVLGPFLEMPLETKDRPAGDAQPRDVEGPEGAEAASNASPALSDLFKPRGFRGAKLRSGFARPLFRN